MCSGLASSRKAITPRNWSRICRVPIGSGVRCGNDGVTCPPSLRTGYSRRPPCGPTRRSSYPRRCHPTPLVTHPASAHSARAAAGSLLTCRGEATWLSHKVPCDPPCATCGPSGSLRTTCFTRGPAHLQMLQVLLGDTRLWHGAAEFTRKRIDKCANYC